jgi:hypothetical protein
MRLGESWRGGVRGWNDPSSVVNEYIIVFERKELSWTHSGGRDVESEGPTDRVTAKLWDKIAQARFRLRNIEGGEDHM